jgi:hypothetical protein
MIPKITARIEGMTGAGGGEADDAEDERGDAEAVARAGCLERGAFHREGHAAALAVVGGDRTEAGAARAADRLLAVAAAEDRGGALAGGGVGVDGVGVLLDDLPRLGVDQPAVAVEDGDGDVVAAGGALPVLGRHRLGGFESRRAVAAVEAVALAAGAGRADEPNPALLLPLPRGGENAPPALLPPAAPAPTPANAGALCASAAGTRSVVRQVGQRTNCPDWASSAESCVRQTWQGKTSISPLASYL